MLVSKGVLLSRACQADYTKQIKPLTDPDWSQTSCHRSESQRSECEHGLSVRESAIILHDWMQAETYRLS